MFKKSVCSIMAVVFVATTLTPQAQAKSLLQLPEPGTMVSVSPAYQPVMLKGVTVHKDNPFLFDFLVDPGDDFKNVIASEAKQSQQEHLKAEGDKLIKYFMATLAIPEKDLWVNLSPYEKDRTVTDSLGQTDMGRDLLAQDYILKQLTASMIYPEKELGKKFWDKIYAQINAKYGNVNIPVNTFNKVWIVADQAEVFERNQSAFVTKSHLKVMLEADYLAANVIASAAKKNGDSHHFSTGDSKKNSDSHQIIREIILPEIEHEVNNGKNFATLRQIFNSIILASWYKNNLKQSLLNEAYANKSNVKGINIDQQINQQIYDRYLQAYKKGVFNLIKEDSNNTPRKYFSGGINPAMAAHPVVTRDAAMLTWEGSALQRFAVQLSEMPAAGFIKQNLKELLTRADEETAAAKFIEQLYQRDKSEDVRRSIEKISGVTRVDVYMEQNASWFYRQVQEKGADVFYVNQNGIAFDTSSDDFVMDWLRTRHFIVNLTGGEKVYVSETLSPSDFLPVHIRTIHDIDAAMGSSYIDEIKAIIQSDALLTFELASIGTAFLVAAAALGVYKVGKNRQDRQAFALLNHSSRVIVRQIGYDIRNMEVETIEQLATDLAKKSNPGLTQAFRDFLDQNDENVPGYHEMQLLFIRYASLISSQAFDPYEDFKFIQKPDAAMKSSLIQPGNRLHRFHALNNAVDHVLSAITEEANMKRIVLGSELSIENVDEKQDYESLLRAIEAKFYLKLEKIGSTYFLFPPVPGFFVRKDFLGQKVVNIQAYLNGVKQEIGRSLKYASTAPIDLMFVKYDKPADKAMSATGGIDLKDAAAKTRVQKEGVGVNFSVDQAMIDRVRQHGIGSLTPVILTIEPVVNVRALYE